MLLEITYSLIAFINVKKIKMVFTNQATCVHLNENYLPWVHIFEHLVLGWWCCSEEVMEPLRGKPSWRRWITGAGIELTPLCSLF